MDGAASYVEPEWLQRGHRLKGPGPGPRARAQPVDLSNHFWTISMTWLQICNHFKGMVQKWLSRPTGHTQGQDPGPRAQGPRARAQRPRPRAQGPRAMAQGQGPGPNVKVHSAQSPSGPSAYDIPNPTQRRGQSNKIHTTISTSPYICCREAIS